MEAVFPVLVLILIAFVVYGYWYLAQQQKKAKLRVTMHPHAQATEGDSLAELRAKQWSYSMAEEFAALVESILLEDKTGIPVLSRENRDRAEQLVGKFHHPKL